MKIYLASKSPRRKELLAQMGIEFEVLAIDSPEIIYPNETPEHYSLRITKEKLAATKTKIIHDHLQALPVLCADTEVVLDGKVLGKPIDRQDAFRMLKNYSGRSHEVITSVGGAYLNYQNTMLNKTIVSFANISDAEINYYLNLNDYMDKAGGYGIQSYIGQFISHIDGCFYSVMGLPLNTVRKVLRDLESKILGGLF